MSNIDEYQKILQPLREIKSFKDWNACSNSLTQLVPHLSSHDLVQIITKLIRRFLTNALNHFPESNDLIQSLAALDSVPSFEILSKQAQVVYGLLKSRAGSPGINNYRNQLKSLAKFETFHNEMQEDIEIVVDAISGIVMGILAYYWGHHILISGKDGLTMRRNKIYLLGLNIL